MKRDPLVSILIPLYNAEKYFSETMESLLDQSYKNIEIIIIDDGSTDSSLALAKKYEDSYKYIKVYSQKNSGASTARNKAFEMSKGEYIQYFDADDIMHVDKILFQIEALREYGFQDGIVVTGSWGRFFDSTEETIFINQTINKNYNDKFLYFKEAWENVEYVIGQAWLLPRSINKKIGGWNTRLSMNDDGEFFTRVAYNSNKIVFVKESIVYYRKGISLSLSSDRSLKSMRSHLDSYRIYADLVKNDLDEHSLHKAVASLYSVFYGDYYPLDKKMREEVLSLLKNLGYDEPVIAFKSGSMWIVRLFGVDAGLYLRGIKTKLVAMLNLYKQKEN